MLLLVVVEDRLLILALINLVVMGPVLVLMPRILLLGYVVFLAGAEIARDDNDVVHCGGGLELKVHNGLVRVLVVLV